MKQVLRACMILVICFALVPSVKAEVLIAPFVEISVNTEEIDLGVLKYANVDNMKAKLKAHIVANCPHIVEASFEGFRHIDTLDMIRPEDTSVIINGSRVSVESSGVIILSSQIPTPKGGVYVPLELDLGVQNAMSYPGGEYKGTLFLTVMPGV